MPGTNPESLTLLQTHLISHDGLGQRGTTPSKASLSALKVQKTIQKLAEVSAEWRLDRVEKDIGLCEVHWPRLRIPTKRMATAGTSGLGRRKKAPGLMDQISHFFGTDKKKKGKVSYYLYKKAYSLTIWHYLLLWELIQIMKCQNNDYHYQLQSMGEIQFVDLRTN